MLINIHHPATQLKVMCSHTDTYIHSFAHMEQDPQLTTPPWGWQRQMVPIQMCRRHTLSVAAIRGAVDHGDAGDRLHWPFFVLFFSSLAALYDEILRIWRFLHKKCFLMKILFWFSCPSLIKDRSISLQLLSISSRAHLPYLTKYLVLIAKHYRKIIQLNDVI